ncbi:putative uncharacterized protein DDB_G0268364 [Dermacentor albipictus]|uniref:putative uncharacterized protein DDB_G0268364 n=1 Tax=Dermacentor albipictus TaxID=60249 RepID=UPI0038FC8BF0
MRTAAVHIIAHRYLDVHRDVTRHRQRRDADQASQNNPSHQQDQEKRRRPVFEHQKAGERQQVALGDQLKGHLQHRNQEVSITEQQHSIPRHQRSLQRCHRIQYSQRMRIAVVHVIAHRYLDVHREVTRHRQRRDADLASQTDPFPQQDQDKRRRPVFEDQEAGQRQQVALAGQLQGHLEHRNPQVSITEKQHSIPRHHRCLQRCHQIQYSQSMRIAAVHVIAHRYLNVHREVTRHRQRWDANQAPQTNPSHQEDQDKHQRPVFEDQEAGQRQQVALGDQLPGHLQHRNQQVSITEEQHRIPRHHRCLQRCHGIQYSQGGRIAAFRIIAHRYLDVHREVALHRQRRAAEQASQTDPSREQDKYKRQRPLFEDQEAGGGQQTAFEDQLEGPLQHRN